MEIVKKITAMHIHLKNCMEGGDRLPFPSNLAFSLCGSFEHIRNELSVILFCVTLVCSYGMHKKGTSKVSVLHISFFKGVCSGNACTCFKQCMGLVQT